MRLLLDTQAWLWMVSAPEKLSERSRETLENPDHELFLSSASAWEIAIKYATGKLRLEEPVDRFVPSRATIFQTSSLPILQAHAVRAGALPRHHRDPFDRMLVAQGQIEDLPIMTSDPVFKRYDVQIIAAA